MKRHCLGCVDELLAAFMKFAEVENLTEANGYNKFYSQNVLGGKGAIDSTHASQDILHMND